MGFEKPSFEEENLAAGINPETNSSAKKAGVFSKFGQKLKTALAFTGLAGTLAGGELQAGEMVKKVAKPKDNEAVPIKVFKTDTASTKAPVYQYEQKTWSPRTPEEEQARQEAIKRLLNESSTQAENLRKEVKQNEQVVPAAQIQKKSQGTQGGTFDSSFAPKRGTNAESTSYQNYGRNQDRGTAGQSFNSRRRR